MKPLLEKELRTRLRGKVIFNIQNFYLSIAAAVIMLIILQSKSLGDMGWALGRSLFSFLTTFQAFLLSLISVSLCASAITLEKEQKTYDMLLVTPLRHGQIIYSKLIASISYVFVLLTISIPLICLSYIFGGISPAEIFWAYLVSFLAIFVFGSVGVWSSTIFKRSLASVPVAIIFATFILLAPFSLAQAGFVSVSTISPICALNLLSNSYLIPFYGREIPFWLPAIVLSVAVCMLFILASIERIKWPSKRSFSKRNLIIVLLYLGSLILLLGSPVKIGMKAGELKKVFSSIFSYHITGMIVLLPLFGFANTVQRRTKKALDGRVVCYLLSAVGVLVMFVMFNLTGFGVVGGLELLYFLAITFSFTLAFSLLARLLSTLKKPRSIAAKRTFFCIILMVIILGPLLLSWAVHRGAKEPPSSTFDLLLVLNPYFAQSTILTPRAATLAYPILAGIVDLIPLIFIVLYFGSCLILILTKRAIKSGR